MQNNTLIAGIAGFLMGGLLVSIAAVTFDKPSETKTTKSSELTMSQMTASLQNKSGDDYDKAFIGHMIAHHQSAVDMAEQSPSRAKHPEIKQLSRDIIDAQEKEINQMKQWQKTWGYPATKTHHSL